MNGIRHHLLRCMAAVVVCLWFVYDGGLPGSAAAPASDQACHPDDGGHREILSWYLTDSEFSADRITHGTNGITMPQIQLVQDTDPECAVLDSFYASSRAMTYGGGSTDKLYMFTYYKAGSNLFVSRSIALSSDPDRYASGVSTFDVFNSAGVFIKGYAF